MQVLFSVNINKNSSCFINLVILYLLPNIVFGLQLFAILVIKSVTKRGLNIAESLGLIVIDEFIYKILRAV